jgi:hypothetical protein
VFELDKEYQRRQREFREDLSQRTNEERQAISEKATKIIKQMAMSKASTSCCRTPSGPATASTSPTRCWRRWIKTNKQTTPDGHSTRSIGRTLRRTVGGRCEPGSHRIAPLADAGVSHISFLSNSKLRAQALQSKAAALIVSPADDALHRAGYSGARIVVPNPYVYFARAAQYFESLTAIVPAAGIHASAVVADSAQVAPAPTSARAR